MKTPRVKRVLAMVALIFLTSCLMTAPRPLTPDQAAAKKLMRQSKVNIQILQNSGLITDINVPLCEALVDGIQWNQKSKEEKSNILFSWIMYLAHEIGRLPDNARMRDLETGKLLAIYQNKEGKIVE